VALAAPARARAAGPARPGAAVPWAFFALALGFAWLVCLPGVLAARGLPTVPVPSVVLVAVAQCGASLAAFVLVARAEGRPGVRRLAARALDVRIPPAWLAAIGLLPLAANAAALALVGAAGGRVPDLPLLRQPWLVGPSFVFVFFLAGPVPEEFGWRGYALDRLQARWSALGASLVLGLFWGVYHLPAFFMAGTYHAALPLGPFLAQVLALAVLTTWVYNGTGRNLLAAMLFHTTANLANLVLPVFAAAPGADQRGVGYQTLLYVALAALVAVLWGPRRLSRPAPAPRRPWGAGVTARPGSAAPGRAPGERARPRGRGARRQRL
jgi:membrane protease YdiL (CAAX protease family)